MSHSSGCVFSVPDLKILGWYEYDGTVDVARTAIFPTIDDLDKAWRTEDSFRECADRPGVVHVEVPVILWSDYAGGFAWPSRVCVTCGVIVGHRSEEEADEAGEHVPPDVFRACVEARKA